MRKLLLSIALGFGLLTALPAAPADADFGVLPQVELVGGFSFDAADRFDAADSAVGGFFGWLRSIWKKIFGDSGSGSRGKPGGGGGRAGVPELDTTFAGAAAVLLFGGVAYIASLRRRREQ